MQKGDQAVNYFFTKRTAKDLQNDRDAVLSTKASDINGFSKMINDMLQQKTYCVYGNVDKLTANGNLFKQLVRIEK
ncbi:MAG: hypothetical protein IPH45_20495 [Bacteroidales bacterium]|nr:hypothetical protein [Bacteroidales bacterium]